MSKPIKDKSGLMPHGARWGEGYIIRATSRGPGVPVEVRNPLSGPPSRVSDGDGTVRLSGRNLRVTPNQAPAGQPFNMTVEF